MNKFVTAFDAIAGSPFPKNVFFNLLTAFHRTRSKSRLPDTSAAFHPLRLSGCFCISKSKSYFLFVPLIDAIAQGCSIFL